MKKALLKHRSAVARKRRRQLRIEMLPARRVLASLGGSVFIDADVSNHLSDGETEAISRIVFLDANADGQVGNDEPMAVVGGDGRYAFDNAASGGSVVALYNAAGTQDQTSPVDASIDAAFGGLVDPIDSAAGNAVLDGTSLRVPNVSQTSLSNVALPAEGTSIAALGGSLYLVAVDGSGTNTAVIDTVAGTVTPYDLSGDASSIALADVVVNDSGQGLALPDAAAPLRVIDMTDPSNPSASVSLTTFVSGSSLIGSATGQTTVVASPVSGGLDLALVSNADGSVISQSSFSGSGVMARSFHADAGLLAIQVGDSTTVLDVSNNFASLYTVDGSGPTFLDPDRDRMVIADQSGQLSIFDIDDGRGAGFALYESGLIGDALDVRVREDRGVEVVGSSGVALMQLDDAKPHVVPANTDRSNLDFGVFVRPGNAAPQFDSLRTLEVDEDEILAISGSEFLGASSDANGDDFIVVKRQDVTSGSLTLNPDGSLLYQPIANFFGTDSFSLWLHDGQDHSEEIVIVIDVLAVPDSPTGGEPDVLPLPENAPIGFPFGPITIFDVDGPNHDFEIDDERFEIDDDGVIILIGGPINHETEPFIDVEITVSDRETNETINLFPVIEVLDRNDPITGITPTTARVPENTPGALVAELEALDEDQPEQFILLTVDDPRFVIIDDDLRLADGVSLDFEETPSLTVDVTATEFDGENTFTQTITIFVDDALEQPTGLTLTDNVVTALVPGDIVGDILLDNQTPSDRYEFMVDDAGFVFDGATLKVPDGNFISNGGSQIFVTVTAVDRQGEFLTIQEDFVIDVIANDYPAHNLDNPFDADHNGDVEPLDVVVIINYIRANGPGAVGDGPLDFCYDVNGDGLITPLDALLVINHLNRRSLLDMIDTEDDSSSDPPEGELIESPASPLQIDEVDERESRLAARDKIMTNEDFLAFGRIL